MIGYFAMLLSVSANVLVINKNKHGFTCWIIANVIWIALAVLNKDYPQIIMFVVYLFLAILGLIQWSRKT